MKKRPVWLVNLSDAVKASMCYSQVLRYLGLATQGRYNRERVKYYISELNLDISHFDRSKVFSEAAKKK